MFKKLKYLNFFDILDVSVFCLNNSVIFHRGKKNCALKNNKKWCKCNFLAPNLFLTQVTKNALYLKLCLNIGHGHIHLWNVSDFFYLQNAFFSRWEDVLPGAALHLGQHFVDKHTCKTCGLVWRKESMFLFLVPLEIRKAWISSGSSPRDTRASSLSACAFSLCFQHVNA